MATFHLDARRLLCPMPVIKTQAKIKELEPGDLLEIVCTDPGVLHDIPAWCRVHGHRLIQAQEIAGEVIITVQKI